MRRLAALGLAIVVAACTGTRPGASGSEASAPAAPSATASPTLALSITSSSYGAVQVKTDPGASCTLAITVNPGRFGDGPPPSLSATADATGVVVWTYAAPLVPAGRSKHTVQCSGANGSASVSADFDVHLKILDARGFTVRTRTVDVTGLDGVETRLDPSLVPARDAVLARVNSTLASEWKAATRGLGALTLVPTSADIAIYVLPGRGTSLHSTAPDGTERVLLYVVDEFGAVSPENAVAVALHELGHIWCCFGPDAGPDGHWLQKIPDPLLKGVDQYGLMTHPVTCLVGRGFESCPNRFSERELRTMGFTEIPPPPPDPCLTRRDALAAQLTSAAAAIDAEKAQAADIDARIKAIEAQYPSRVLPPAVYDTYQRLVDQYNALADDVNAKAAAYNSLVNQINALPC